MVEPGQNGDYKGWDLQVGLKTRRYCRHPKKCCSFGSFQFGFYDHKVLQKSHGVSSWSLWNTFNCVYTPCSVTPISYCYVSQCIPIVPIHIAKIFNMLQPFQITKIVRNQVPNVLETENGGQKTKMHKKVLSNCPDTPPFTMWFRAVQRCFASWNRRTTRIRAPMPEQRPMPCVPWSVPVSDIFLGKKMGDLPSGKLTVRYWKWP